MHPAADDRERAADRVWPVIVIGAGPAGASMALRLARAGVGVLLLDRARFPRETVCGCCLNHRALAHLAELGLAHLIDAAGAPGLERLSLHAQRRCARVGLEGGRVLSRAALDDLVVRAAAHAGATVRTGVSARVTQFTADDVTVETKTGAERAAVVVVADGLHGTSLSGHPSFEPRVAPDAHIGVAAHVAATDACAPGELIMCCGVAGYVGLVRLERDRVDCAAALDPEEIRRHGSPEDAVRAVLDETGGPTIDLNGARWMGTGRLTRDRPRCGGHRLFVIGDAASYAEPFTGEGIAWALSSAALAASLVGEAAYAWRPGLAQGWDRTYRAHVRRRQRACRMFASVLRRPTLTRAAIGAAARAPWLAAPIVRHVTGAARRKTA